MASETITRNDLTAILNEVLPPTPSEYRTLLWTNPSPSSGFAAQTISLDLSDYDEVEIECLASAGGTDFVTERCLIGNAVMAQFVSGGNGYGSGTPFLTERRFVTSTSGITASTGYGCFTGSSDWSYNSTTRMIPYKIYGIKYNAVAPPTEDSLWQTISAIFAYKKTSGFVTVKGWSSNTATISAGADYTVGTLPIGYRPSQEFVFIANMRGTLQTSFGKVQADGSVIIHNDTSSAQSYWQYNVTFPLG